MHFALFVIALSVFGTAEAASPLFAGHAEEPLVLEGDQTGTLVRIAPDYLPEAYDSATAIYAEGRPKFVVPP